MRSLQEVLEGVEVQQVIGDRKVKIGEPQIDSRKIQAKGLFVAIKGTQTDGHKFIENVVQNNAAVVVCVNLPDQLDPGVVWVQVENPARAVGIIAHNYYGRPSDQLSLVGVTGTNGKTTTVTLLHDLMTACNEKAGLLSTVENRIGDTVVPSTHTTPDPTALNKLLGEMVEAGCEYAFMEVSSHAIDQERIAGLTFAGAVFTNITHDHLDYHKTFKHYLETKKKFFDGLGAQAFALVNVDDPRGNVIVQNTAAKVSKYSLRKLADFKAKILSNHIDGLHLRLDDVEMISRLVGDFNAYNLLSVYATAILLGFEKHDVITALSGLAPVEGRFDLIRSAQSDINVIVDYAHTPDALKKVLSTLRQLKRKGARLIVVVGCGGDRDKAKRPIMAQLASSLGDLAILTSDNPRSEDPDEILRDMAKGVAKERASEVLTITDRQQAIRTAVQLARKGDIILVAGKGHEKYQDIKGIKYPFDDKDIVRKALYKDI